MYHQFMDRRYMAEILPIRRKTLFINQSIILWRSDLSKMYPSPYVEKKEVPGFN